MKIFELFNPPWPSIKVTRRYLEQLSQPGKGRGFMEENERDNGTCFYSIERNAKKNQAGSNAFNKAVGERIATGIDLEGFE